MSGLISQQAAVPAHVLAAFGTPANNDLAANVSVGYPIISYKGKTWSVVEGGERTVIVRGGEGADAGDPVAALSAVILRANPNLNKVYYPDGYEEGSTERPLCHSDDGVAPAADAQEQQAKSCAVCPYNQWGSKATGDNAGKGKACADSRRLAIAAPDDLENPMLLRVPAASLKSLLAYSQQLDKRGWPYQALVTRIGFVAEAAYPSLTFSPERWLDAEELDAAKETYDGDLVRNICALTVAPAPAPAPAPEPEADAFASMEAQVAEKPATRTRATRAKADPAPVEAAAPKATGFGGAGGKAKPAPAAAATTAAPAAALAELDSVLAGFDDEDEGDQGED